MYLFVSDDWDRIGTKTIYVESPNSLAIIYIAKNKKKLPTGIELMVVVGQEIYSWPCMHLTLRIV